MIRIVFKSGRILDLDNIEVIFMDRKPPAAPEKAVKIKYLNDCKLVEYDGLEDFEDQVLPSVIDLGPEGTCEACIFGGLDGLQNDSVECERCKGVDNE